MFPFYSSGFAILSHRRLAQNQTDSSLSGPDIWGQKVKIKVCCVLHCRMDFNNICCILSSCSRNMQHHIHFCSSLQVHGRGQKGQTQYYHNIPKYLDRYAYTNSVDPDQMPQNAASDQGLPCLPYIQLYFRHIKR